MSADFSIIFDLDGTLVDSSLGILGSLAEAFKSAKVKPIHPLDSSLIGPPLRETITYLAPGLTRPKVDQIISAFKCHYDHIGYRETKPFAGVCAALYLLKSQGVEMHIATNKRTVPTRLILAYLGWSGLFNSVYSSDSIQSISPTKAELLSSQLMCEGLSSDCTYYIGDRLDDWYSASANGVRFVWAQWGYSSSYLEFSDNSLILHSPDLLQSLPGIACS